MRPLAFLAENLHPPKYLSEKEFKLGLAIGLSGFFGVAVSAVFLWLGIYVRLFTFIIFFFFSVAVVVGLLGTLTNYIRHIRNWNK